MRQIKFYLHLLMFIGVGVTLLHFFSTPVHADGPVSLNQEYTINTLDQNNNMHYVYIKFYTDNLMQTGTSSYRYFATVSCPDNIIGKFVLNLDNNSNTLEISYSQGNQNVYVGGQSPMTNSSGLPYIYSYKCIDLNDVTFTNSNLKFKGVTTDFSSFDTSTGHWVDAGKWFCFDQTQFEDNKTNDIYIMEVPIGNVTINPSDIEIAYYSTFNNQPNKAFLSNLYIQQTVSKLYIYFTLNEKFAAWPYGSGILCLKANKRVYLYNNTFKLLKIPYLSDDYFDIITDLKLWNFLDQYTNKPEESTHVDDSNSSFNSSSQQMIDLEDQLQGDFNSAIGSIDIPSNPFNDFGSSFGNSSRFLVYMFDQMTISNGSPFGTVITFSLILGLALLMIGKKGSR